MIAREEHPGLEDDLTVFERRIQALCSDLGVSMKRLEIKDTATTLLSVWQKYRDQWLESLNQLRRTLERSIQKI